MYSSVPLASDKSRESLRLGHLPRADPGRGRCADRPLNQKVGSRTGYRTRLVEIPEAVHGAIHEALAVQTWVSPTMPFLVGSLADMRKSRGMNTMINDGENGASRSMTGKTRSCINETAQLRTASASSPSDTTQNAGFSSALAATPEAASSVALSSSLKHISVARELALDIIEGRWESSQSFTLEDIQHRFDVSRTVAREVTRLLSDVGAIKVRRRKGINPQPTSMWTALNPVVIEWMLHSSKRSEELRALTELRLAVEPIAAAKAAEHAPVEIKSRMPVLAREMRKAGESGDLDDFHAMDIEFHSLLLKYSGNDLFAALSDIVATILRGRVEIGLYPQRPEPEALAAHEEVAEGIWRSDPSVAREGMRRIVDEVDEAISQFI
ncbi:FadR/GntR family transcriptional regulator [Bifidobacterium aquikefiri]|uniref:FadR/GntR family transcriptional regulator n=2 Tax=Bifidobacterium aquikefiri TaxID=1653207 RepID=UPI0039EAA5F9